MDVLTVLFLLAIAFVGVWTVRTVRRVGVRRFTVALRAFLGTLVAAVLKLFSPKRVDEETDGFYVADALRVAREGQKLTADGTIPESDPSV